VDKFEFTMNGRRVSLSRDEVVRSVRHQPPEPIQTWAVEVEGRRYPVKQVFSAATGEKRENFISHRARDVLRRLDFRVIDISDQHHEDGPRALAGAVGGAEAGDDEQPSEARLAALAAAIELVSNRPDCDADTVLEVATAFEAWLIRRPQRRSEAGHGAEPVPGGRND
jgi:hypothetical protein